MKSKLLLVLTAGGVALAAHSAAADPDRQLPPARLPLVPSPTSTGPTTPIPSANPMPTSAPAPTTTPIGADPTSNEPVQEDPSKPAPIVTTTPVLVTPPPSSDSTVAPSDIPGVYTWRESRLASGIGVGITVGGGVSGFTDRMMRNTVSSDISGLWDLRVSIGTHLPIALDVSYVGTAASLRTLSGANNGTLIGTTTEAAVRFNLSPHRDVTPYAFAGAGWQRYDVRNMAFATSDTGLTSHDNLLEIPIGAGLSYRDRSGFTVDVRGTFRAAVTDSSLVRETNGTNADLHTWEASGALGWEF